VRTIQALQTIQHVLLEPIKQDCAPQSKLAKLLDQYTSSDQVKLKHSCHVEVTQARRQVQTVSQLFCYTLDLLSHETELARKTTIFDHLAVFTREILFGEAFEVNAGDGRKTAGSALLLLPT